MIYFVCLTRPSLHRREDHSDWWLGGNEVRGELISPVGGSQPGEVVQPGGHLTTTLSLIISHYHRLRSYENRKLSKSDLE